MRRLGFTGSVQDTGSKVKPLVGSRRNGRKGTKSWQRSMVSTQREKAGRLEGKSSDTAAKHS